MIETHSQTAMQTLADRVEANVPVELPIGFEEVMQRLAPRARAIEVVASPARGPRAPRLLFIPGEDDSGRHDACLVDEATYEQGAPIAAYVGGCLYEFHLRRIRARGRGWILAGFEMAAALAHPNIASAPATAPLAARGGRH